MSSLRSGTILGQTYEILEEIGSGGGGIVYRARHLRLQTDVVVKKIKDEALGKIQSRREADILKNLKHPYLPRVYDFIEAQDGVYTVMDFIQGENLDDAIKRQGRYPEKQVREWAAQLGEALAYLHSRKPAIIHSDIKPANIMLTSDGNVCLIDFNISLAMGGDMKSVVGISAGFSPPEQYRDPDLYEKVTHNYTRQQSGAVPVAGNVPAGSAGSDRTEVLTRNDRTEVLTENDRTEVLTGNDRAEVLTGNDGTEILTGNDRMGAMPRFVGSQYRQYIGRGIDARSDIYSLGVTLCYLLTGIKPAVDFDARIPLSEARVAISEGFALLLTTMTQENPAKRYQNGGDFLKALRNCHKLDRRYVAMHRKEIGLQIASLACLCVGIVIGIGGMYRIRQEKDAAYYGFLEQAQEAMDRNAFEEAEAFLAMAKDVRKERIDAYAEEVRVLYESGDYEACIALGENYINTAPFLVEEEDGEWLANLYYLVGNACFERKDYADAARFLEAALGYYAGNALYYRDYAIALAKMGQETEAASVLEKGIAAGLLQDSVYMAQGEIAHVQGGHDKAAEYLRKAIEITQDRQMKKRAVLLCAEVYQSKGVLALDDEIALLEQYTGEFGGQGSLVMMEYLAQAYARKAKTDAGQSRQYYEKALELFQSVREQGYTTFQMQENIAILQETLGEFDEAETLLLEMAADYPKRYEPYKRLAFLEADRQQEKENADRDYRQMRTYYEQALMLYGEAGQDMEMEMLAVMMRELEDGGWF